MYKAIPKLWSVGVADHPVRLRRQIELSNQVGLFGIVATVPYQLFYLFALDRYLGVFLANLLFMAVYLSILLLNNARRHTTASHVLLVNASVQLFVVTLFIGTEAGVNLFYFTLSAILVLLYQRLRMGVYAAVMAWFGLLYVVTHFLFTAETALSPVPPPWSYIMYVVSVTCGLTLLAIFLYLFRQQIERVEDELMTVNRTLTALSHTDPLTGLANRRVLDEALEIEWARLARQPGALSVIMCDVDEFKRFNDQYGHDGGDECLKRIASTLVATLSRPGDRVVRYGGEEFVFILPGTDEQGARHLGRKLCTAIRQLEIANAGTSTGRVTVSIGLSSIDTRGVQVARPGAGKHLFKCADQALYQAKENGRDRVEFWPYSHTEAR